MDKMKTMSEHDSQDYEMAKIKKVVKCMIGGITK